MLLLVALAQESHLTSLRAALLRGAAQSTAHVAPQRKEEAAALWTAIATNLRDTACTLGVESAGSLPTDDVAALCDDVLEMARRDDGLYAVAKFSAKRNGLSAAVSRGDEAAARRASERCLAELGLLISSHAVLSDVERAQLLDSVRPLTQTVPTAQRVAALLVVCRGFFSPGAGSAHGWRTGGGTIQQLLAGWEDEAPAAARARLEPLLESREEARRRSLRLRAT